MQWLIDQVGFGFVILFMSVGFLWNVHGKRVKSFMKDNPVGQVAKKAATDKAISLIFKLLK